MKRWLCRLSVTTLSAASITAAAAPEPVENLIEELRAVEDAGYGYSALFSGSQFLPRPDSAQWSTMVLGVEPPKNSGVIGRIVERGAQAIPALVNHLDDARPAKIKPVSGMMWMSWDDEYDYNHRTRFGTPPGVNRQLSLDDDEKHPQVHQITVGDLCFVALGQIVNRNFQATRYQPTGGMVVSSPTYSKTLLKVVRADYQNMTEKEHRQQLLDDLTQPDHDQRRNGAAMRLGHYYPAALDEPATRQIQVPTFDVFREEAFVHEVLYREKSSAKREQRLKAHVGEHGEAAKDGVLLRLFEDLDTQIADEEGRMHPPLSPKYDARNALVQLFGYKPSVTPQDRPYVKSWAATAVPGFIDAVGPAATVRFQKEVERIFTTIQDDDDLALACIKVLRGKGLDAELAAYCRRRIGKEKYYEDKLREVLKELEN